MRCSLALILLAAVLASGSALSAPGKTAITRLRVPVLAAANVGFRADGVKAVVGDTTAKVVALASPAEDLILMLVLDLAGDVTVAQRGKQALLDEIQQLPRQTHIALLRAQDGLRVIQDPTMDRPAIKKAIESLPVGGRAGLVDSIETAAAIGDSMLSKSAVRVAILYITDSEVTNYRQDFTNPVINSSDAGDLSRKFPEALIQEKISKLNTNLTRTQVPVFVVHLTYRSDRLNEAYLNGLRQLAISTGGMAVVCRSSAEIPAAIRDVVATIVNHYSVTLEVPRMPARPVAVNLQIAGPDGAPQALAYRSVFVLKDE